ncbi:MULTISPECIES: EF-P beta-lysylation protein EpmB [unclassified Wenzhouxiangella]|uniref:EF-P beta-lysylation protein EpmB n=1 Tax=unclassified Wenzhouxiangella TaxID=2613841 RepID=UPI000E328928|nr:MULTISPECIES: EF-P beta-lysylation protein EpmB [unclassified Wenzhouxiangella]RFF28352.1 EF-P beta-lysylation protein EpmB [Wenzhouxiangella sp. 15181]RFP68051.1 EF-P beta-lysylation protein EpmB [Wenzhouxiangella sp. 15190]
MKSHSLARTAFAPKPIDWRDHLRQAARNPAELLERLGLALADEPAGSRFPMLVPQPFIDRMQPGDRRDPLLLQVLPDRSEEDRVSGYNDDPVGDRASSAGRGLLHKYRGRVLLVATGACAVHCRYCFRQAFPYATEHAGNNHWRPALEYIAGDESIEEVILSGGDPLMLPTGRLQELTTQLSAIPHIRRLRIHTRLPIILPDRVTGNLLDWIGNLPWPTVMVVHANHANEFDDAVDEGIRGIRGRGAHVLNQAVLLAGINDSAPALSGLMRRSFAAGALPYYLHLLDPVSGAQRFESDESRAVDMMETLRRELSGYLVPRLVREVAGEPYKLPVL